MKIEISIIIISIFIIIISNNYHYIKSKIREIKYKKQRKIKNNNV